MFDLRGSDFAVLFAHRGPGEVYWRAGIFDWRLSSSALPAGRCRSPLMHRDSWPFIYLVMYKSRCRGPALLCGHHCSKGMELAMAVK